MKNTELVDDLIEKARLAEGLESVCTRTPTTAREALKKARQAVLAQMKPETEIVEGTPSEILIPDGGGIAFLPGEPRDGDDGL